MAEESDYYDLNSEMFSGNFEKLEKYKFNNGEHKLRFLPPYKKNTLYVKVDLHWGYTDQNDKKYPVKCIGKGCPICEESNRIKAKGDEIKAHSNGDPQKLKEGDALLKRANDIRRKPTYIYQVLDINGSHKQFSVSYKQHMAVFGKIKFYYEQKKINVLDPNKNMIIYIDRQGKGNQTNYQVEVLEDTIKKIDVPKLAKLHELHQDRTYEELKKIVDTGFLPIRSSDNEQGFIEDDKDPGNVPEYMDHIPETYNEVSHEYQNQKEGIDFKSRTNNQNGVSSHNTTEGRAEEVGPSPDNSAQTSSNVEFNKEQQQTVNKTINSFNTDDIQF